MQRIVAGGALVYAVFTQAVLAAAIISARIVFSYLFDPQHLVADEAKRAQVLTHCLQHPPRIVRPIDWLHPIFSICPARILPAPLACARSFWDVARQHGRRHRKQLYAQTRPLYQTLSGRCAVLHNIAIFTSNL
jgi:hypothetical protein